MRLLMFPFIHFGSNSAPDENRMNSSLYVSAALVVTNIKTSLLNLSFPSFSIIASRDGDEDQYSCQSLGFLIFFFLPLTILVAALVKSFLP